MTRNRNVCRATSRDNGIPRFYRCRMAVYAPRDLSFIEIVAAWSAERSRLFRIIERQNFDGIAAGGSTTETVHYVTRSRIATLILNAPLFSFTPHSSNPRPRRCSRNFNETLLAAPVKILVALLHSRDPARSYGFTLEFPCTIYVAEPPLAAQRKIL